jgi:hypothetical protein
MQQAADHIILLKMKSKIFSILCGCTRKAQQYIGIIFLPLASANVLSMREITAWILTV